MNELDSVVCNLFPYSVIFNRNCLFVKLEFGIVVLRITDVLSPNMNFDLSISNSSRRNAKRYSMMRSDTCSDHIVAVGAGLDGGLTFRDPLDGCLVYEDDDSSNGSSYDKIM